MQELRKATWSPWVFISSFTAKKNQTPANAILPRRTTSNGREDSLRVFSEALPEKTPKWRGHAWEKKTQNWKVLMATRNHQFNHWQLRTSTCASVAPCFCQQVSRQHIHPRTLLILFTPLFQRQTIAKLTLLKILHWTNSQVYQNCLPSWVNPYWLGNNLILFQILRNRLFLERESWKLSHLLFRIHLSLQM